MAKYPGNWKSMAHMRCPRCRYGRMFPHGTYSAKFMEMHDECPHCDMDFEPETGFYWAAMYITYAFNAGLALVTSTLLYFLFDNPAIEVYVGVVAGLGLVLTPVFLRYSRVLLLYTLGGATFHPELYPR